MAGLTNVNDSLHDADKELKITLKDVAYHLGLSHAKGLGVDRDDEEAIADGFYFTVSYPGRSGSELVGELTE